MLFCHHCGRISRTLCPSVSLACGDDDPDGLGEGRGGVAGVRAGVHGGVRAPDDERGDDVVRPPVDHDGPHAVAVVGDDLNCSAIFLKISLVTA